MTTTSPPPLIDWGVNVVRPPRVGVPARGLCRFAGETIACELQASAACILRDHALITPRLEVGGLLVGDVYDLEGRFHVDVSDALPAERAISAELQLRFGLAAWLDLTRERHRRPHQRVVGWYHTHPGIGVFLSSVDRDLHGAFFCGEPWYVALVFDPSSDELGAFACDGGMLCRLSSSGEARLGGPEVSR